jgi:hypothetical protein
MRRWLIMALVASTPHAGHAGGLAEELSAGASPAAGSRWIGNQLAAIWDIDSRWLVRLDLSATRSYSNAAGGAHDDSYLGSLSAAFGFDEHWHLRLNASSAPVATTRATAALEPDPLPGMAVLDVDLHATASWFSLGAGLDYSSASDGMHALGASLSLAETYFETHQEVVRVTDRNTGAAFDAAEARSRWLAACTGQLMPQSAQLAQFMVDASVTDTVDGDTDLTLGVSYYLYGDDPMKPGYFALATLEATTRGSATSAPLLRDAFTPSVTHRWDDLSASASLSYTGYARSEFDVGANLSVEYQVSLAGKRRLSLHARLGGQSHADKSYQFTRSGSLGLGAQYSW